MFPRKIASLSLLAGAALLTLSSAAQAADAKKIRVGFAQTGAESVWRIANTESMKSEAEKRGIDLRFADGQSKPENQIRAVRSFVAQKVDAIVLAPLVVTGWDNVLREAKNAGIPVIIMDRKVVTADDSLYTAFIGSDFYTEGKMVADWLATHAGERRRIVELQGEPGSAAANERRRAFADAMAKHAGFKIIDSQTGNFRRADGKQVMEALLKKHGRDIEILYAHNDDMALGAIQAIEEAGLKPGKDIMVVSIDAIKEGIQAVVDGKINCTVECNPLFGPKVYDAIEKILKGEPVPKEMYNKDGLFDSTNAAAALPTRKY
ncbi:MAG TPA: ABC transporter substrate-binding protein [Opitutaceae bacterium]|nr:ABC transporter substrate-binding protein [Opitutaceae bacterium]